MPSSLQLLARQQNRRKRQQQINKNKRKQAFQKWLEEYFSSSEPYDIPITTRRKKPPPVPPRKVYYAVDGEYAPNPPPRNAPNIYYAPPPISTDRDAPLPLPRDSARKAHNKPVEVQRRTTTTTSFTPAQLQAMKGNLRHVTDDTPKNFKGPWLGMSKLIRQQKDKKPKREVEGVDEREWLVDDDNIGLAVNPSDKGTTSILVTHTSTEDDTQPANQGPTSISTPGGVRISAADQQAILSAAKHKYRGDDDDDEYNQDDDDSWLDGYGILLKHRKRRQPHISSAAMKAKMAYVRSFKRK